MDYAFSPLAIEVYLGEIGAYEGGRTVPKAYVVIVSKRAQPYAARIMKSAPENGCLLVHDDPNETGWWIALVQPNTETLMYGPDA